jgi:predicted metal-dependent phosphoesterase TrpH
MARVDCHVHSIFSDHPSEWFLQRIGTKESYSPPEFIYERAIKGGMTFVTLTDHNTIDGVMQLREKYPSKVFTGVESTAYFPENHRSLPH